MDAHRLPHPRNPQRQRGMSMLFAMLTLMVLSLAAVALVRSVDTGALVVGNLGFKQGATAASDVAMQRALTWLNGVATTVTVNANGAPGSGYFATSLEDLDVTGKLTSTANKMALVDWLGDGTCSYVDPANFSGVCIAPKTEVLADGSSAKWVIMRMCAAAGAVAAGNTCSRPKSTSVTNSTERGELRPGGRITAAVSSPYYRVVVRAQGPRNTVSFTESIVHF
jgi:type IV pilus assembly protein PilX